MYEQQRAAVVVSIALLGLAGFQAAAAAEPGEDEAERCVSLHRISSTDVVDERNILFYMRGGDVYLNRLPHPCPGLRNQRTFMYRTSLSQLCDLDVITVLYSGGFGFTPGPSCGLGRFHPITAEEAKALKESPAKEIEPDEVPSAEPEDLRDEAQTGPGTE